MVRYPKISIVNPRLSVSEHVSTLERLVIPNPQLPSPVPRTKGTLRHLRAERVHVDELGVLGRTHDVGEAMVGAHPEGAVRGALQGGDAVTAEVGAGGQVGDVTAV